MPTNPKTPSDAELRILDVLWRHGPLTIREIANRLYGDPTATQYRTVQVQLDRLEKKRLVARDRGVSPQCFSAALDQSHFIGSQLESMADRVCGGSMSSLLLNLVQRTKLSDAEKQELSRLLEADDESDDGAEEDV